VTLHPSVGAGALVICAIFLSSPAPALSAKKEAPPSSGWPEITPAERSLTTVAGDPEADAVVLFKQRDGRIVQKADDYVNVLNYHWRLKVLTERGKRYGEVNIRASKGSRVDAIEARTIRPDGTIVPLALDQIFEKVVLQVGAFKLTEKVFNFPAVEPGAILEYRYQRHDNGMLFLDPYFFAGEEFTLRSRVSQGFLAGTSYTILCDLCPSVQPTIGEWREGKHRDQLYAMELKDVPGYREEMLMPPARETTPRLDMVLHLWKNQLVPALGRQDRFFTDWASVAGWVAHDYGKVIKDGQPSIKPLVDGWIQGATDSPAKVRAIVRHVRDDFRFIPDTRVVGASRSVEALIKDKTADNEEKAVLLLAALKAVGVDGLPVLVSGKDVGSLNPKFFSLSQFTHVIAAIPKPDGTKEWIDPTISYAPYAFMPWRDAGAGALLIQWAQGPQPVRGDLVDLPPRMELNTTRYRVTLKPRGDGKADADLQAEFKGEDAIDVRQELVPASETARAEWIKGWLEDHRPGSALQSQAIENLEDVEKPLILKLTFKAPGLVTVADDVFVVHGCVISCLEANPLSRANRVHPFYVDRGWNVEESVVIQPPKDGLTAQQMPPMSAAKSAIGSSSFSCSGQSEGGVRCLRQFAARRNRWPAEENAAARAMFDRIVQADRTTVAFAAASGS